ncbi:hypothetical protein EW146_g173 [Bondarzewia mesenterica]|uniref:ABC1 atypical kinase-like domain-containing protein n=1 Tax=Bondarzewia mesenterica TaxID=1095465 RepID=A0A4S4MA16_9AGAM|nr:hypothetical protein EW146_g173 [Bondarzewia mesenterica]
MSVNTFLRHGLSRRLVFHSRLPHQHLSTVSNPVGLKNPSRSKTYARRSIYLAAVLGVGYVADRELYASTVTRNLHTFWTCALIAFDYKLNFTPDSSSDDITALHERVGNRVFSLLTSNGGLYIKFGQAIGANAALLPRPIQAKFARLFDDAPQIPYAEVQRVFESEFGLPPSGPDGVFAEFEQQAVASASVAQVHRARLKGEDTWVAVKVQKPAVSKQMEPDLAAFRAVMAIYEYMFELPASFMVDFVSRHLRQELDFENEAQNAMRTATFVADDPTLAGRVYIPKVYPEYTSKRVMTAEWIDGVRMSDRAGIMNLMGEGRRVHHRTSSSSPSADSLASLTSSPVLKGGVKAIMETMVELFGAQIFRWGWVHCDPHPGNILIRANPTIPDRPQLVLLDHGLYIRMNPTFQRQYAQLWKALLAMDMDTITDVTSKWGIGAPDLFASATLMRPVKFSNDQKEKGEGASVEELNQYEASVRMKERLKSFLVDTDKMPKELIFIGRNMRIVQGNNQMLGSPVNRIKITGFSASTALTRAPHLTLVQRIREYWHHLVFLTVVYSIDAAFWVSRAKQWLRALWSGEEGLGFEDELEKSMREIAKKNFGVEMDSTTFAG